MTWSAGYPLETVLAEKIVTMVDRGDATTRERDFADVLVLTRRYVVGAAELAAAVQATGAHRRSDLRPLQSVLITLAASRQSDWERFSNRSGLGDDVPADYAETIAAIADFADPIISGEATSGGVGSSRKSVADVAVRFLCPGVTMSADCQHFDGEGPRIWRYRKSQAVTNEARNTH